MSDNTTLPAVFVTHGSPTMPIDDTPARDFMRGLAGHFPRPKAILAVSAHWERRAPGVSSAAAPETIHDFFGFPDALYEMKWPAPGAPDVAARTKELLDEAGLGCDLDPGQGFDHGTWSVTRLAWPEADIPTAQLSVNSPLGPRHHLELGAALRPLRDEGVLILASGSATHNLREFNRYPLNSDGVNYAVEFADWLDGRVAAQDHVALADYMLHGPHARMNHPSPEHYYPLLVAAGAATPDSPAPTKLHDSYTYGVFYMGAYAFH